MSERNLKLIPGITPNQTITEFLHGKSIFITGGSGFLGKVLIEKILRTCPDVGNIYILMRSRRGVSAQQRWDGLVELPLFDLLKKNSKDALKKVVVVEGDVAQLGLGLSKENRNMLIREVSLVYHVAATVRFVAPLQEAVLLNVRGTREISRLVLEMQNLSAFLHVSTTFCQSGEKVVEEMVYPARASPQQIIEMAENLDEMTFKTISPKLIEGFPNTYTFTKCVAETVIKEMCERKVRTIIYRPSIVMPTAHDPISGWSDSPNGVSNLVYPVGSGVLRVLPMDYDIFMDYVPADSSVQGMIKATWIHQYKDSEEISVYNGSSLGLMKLKSETFVTELLNIYVNKQTIFQPIWYPHLTQTTNINVFWFFVYLYQVIPSLLIDGVLKIMGRKPQLLKVQIKIASALQTISVFLLNEYEFINDKFQQLDDYLLPEDKNKFANEIANTDVNIWLLHSAKIFAELILKEKRDPKKFYATLKKLKYIRCIILGITYVLGFVLIYSCIFRPSLDRLNDYFIGL